MVPVQDRSGCEVFRMKRHETERHARNIVSGILRIDHQQRIHLRPRDQITRVRPNVSPPVPSEHPARVVHRYLKYAYFVIVGAVLCDIGYQIAHSVHAARMHGQAPVHAKPWAPLSEHDGRCHIEPAVDDSAQVVCDQ
jgi:hypothetical protein